MQQLQSKLENVLTDVLQVCSSTNSELNREETLSVQNDYKSSKLDCNNLEGAQRKLQTSGRLSSQVFVLSKHGKPIMPCSNPKARKLLKREKAHVVKRIPRTIQLDFECDEKVQPVILDIDSGSNFIGFSAKTDKKELISGKVEINDRTKKNLEKRKMYRRNRRSRLWYRKSRFNNRKRKEGWLLPSIQRKLDIHLSLIARLKKLLPITKTTVEVGKFDIAKLENPEIQGIQYQQGDMYGYRNRIAYLLAREEGKCQYCGERHKDNDGWRLHHIYGHDHDRSKDWALVHNSCHHELHEKHLEHILRDKPSKSFKDADFMNKLRCRFIKMDFEVTYGYKTYQKRIELGLEKSHVNDAFAISGTDQVRCRPFHLERKRRHNRCLQYNRKRTGISIRKQRYDIQPKDLVWFEGQQYRVLTIQTHGCQTKVENSKKLLPTKKIEKVYHFYGFAWVIKKESNE